MKQTQIAIRLPLELLRRVEEHRDRLEADNAGVRLSRAAAVRSLLTSALDGIDKLGPSGRVGRAS